MPHYSEMVIVGNLTYQPLVLNSGNILFTGKTVRGLFLFRWMTEITKEERAQWFKIVADDLRDGGHIFGTKVAKIVPLDEWKEALEESATIATEGKILLKISNK